MVTHSRASSRPDQLRPLNRPRPVGVMVEDGLPIAVIDGGHGARIERIQETWCIDDEWWRDPIARRYYRVRLETGTIRTLYEDRFQDAWFEQGY